MSEKGTEFIAELIQREQILNRANIFRGVSKSSYELISNLGRKFKGLDFNASLIIEKEVIDLFKLEGHPYFEYKPANEGEFLALAQHHGVPTRLLDWTRNLLVALFFAVNKNFDEDGAVYVHRMKFPNDFVKFSDVNPLDVEQLTVFMPSVITQMISAQNGVFTSHKDPRVAIDIDDEEIEMILIPKDLKLHIYENLYLLGIHNKALFPGLRGVADWINYTKFNITHQ